MRTATLEIYRDARREWRWRLKASNGRILADSGEGYRRKSSAIHGARRVRELIAAGKIKEVIECSAD
jgi:uncharacterized protein YegP (UPF0339 family)